jgi:hypothetical protein
MSPSDLKNNNPSVPILVGITGHRDIIQDDIPKLKSAISREYDQLKAICGNCNIVVILALAEGADRIAAQVALDQGLELWAVLPMPRAEYEKDFTDPASLIEFRDLLRGAINVIELPILNHVGKPTVSFDEINRVLQYEQLGLFISSNCHILLALWDGVESGKRGGTANVVNMRRGKPDLLNPTIIYSRSYLPIGYGIQIRTPRQSQPVILEEPYTSCPIVPDSWMPAGRAREMFEKIIHNICELNHDIKSQTQDYSEMIEKSRRYLFNNQGNIPSAESIKKYIDYYSLLDSLANRFKAARVKTITLLFVLVISAFFWLELHLKILPMISGFPRVIVALVYLILISPILLLYRRAKKGRYDEKHEDYRVLAEALRVQTVWSLSGLSNKVYDYCVPKQAGELSWIRIALFGWIFPYANDSSLRESDYEFVRVKWVEGQRDFYKRSSEKNTRAVKRIAKFGTTLIITCVIMALLLCLPALSPYSAKEGIAMWVSRCLGVIGTLFLVLAAARYQYADMLAWKEQIQQYTRMGQLFDLANKTLRHLASLGHSNEIQDVLYSLGKEALTEHGDWLIMHRARPLEVPRL